MAATQNAGAGRMRCKGRQERPESRMGHRVQDARYAEVLTQMSPPKLPEPHSMPSAFVAEAIRAAMCSAQVHVDENMFVRKRSWDVVNIVPDINDHV